MNLPNKVAVATSKVNLKTYFVLLNLFIEGADDRRWKLKNSLAMIGNFSLSKTLISVSTSRYQQSYSKLQKGSSVNIGVPCFHSCEMKSVNQWMRSIMCSLVKLSLFLVHDF